MKKEIKRLSLTLGMNGRVNLDLPDGSTIKIMASRLNGVKETRLVFEMSESIKATRLPPKSHIDADTMEELDESRDNIGNTYDESIQFDDNGRLLKGDSRDEVKRGGKVFLRGKKFHKRY